MAQHRHHLEGRGASMAPESETILDYLESDHALLRDLLDRAGAGETIDLAAFAAFRSRLLRHIGIEEKVLLPAARDASGAPLSRARQLRVEHGAIASLLVPPPDLALIAELRALLVAHDALEEGPTGVYAECSEILGTARCVELARAAERFPEVPPAHHFDGEQVVRTAEDALRAAQRIRYLK